MHFTSHYARSLFFFSNYNSNSIHSFGSQAHKNNSTPFGAYLYSAGTWHGNLQPARWPICFCRPTQEPVLATHKKSSGKVLGKMQVNGPGRGEISKEKSPGNKRSMCGYILTIAGFKGRTFKLCVLNRLDFNFCVRSYPPQGVGKRLRNSSHTLYFSWAGDVAFSEHLCARVFVFGVYAVAATVLATPWL